MSKHFSTVQHNVWLPYRFALGPNFYRWFEGLKEEKIWGNRCPKCGKVLVPARTFCPECNVDKGEWIEVSHEGRIVTWIVANRDFYGAPAKAPLVYALLRLDGTDCNLLHLIGGVNAADQAKLKGMLKSGTRVRAVWNPEKRGHMLDLMYFQRVE